MFNRKLTHRMLKLYCTDVASKLCAHKSGLSRDLAAPLSLESFSETLRRIELKVEAN